jgi:hypothetical protein
MQHKMKTSLIRTITFALIALLIPVQFVDAKGSSSSGRSSFSSSSSRSSSPSRSSFSSSSSSKSSAPTTKPSAILPKSSTTTKNAFDRSQATRSVTPPKPKTEYVADFKRANAGKYPTTFSTPPAQRPSYIPPRTTYNGSQRDIIYNQQSGGYGFFDDLGKFMIYDAITDMAFNSHKQEEVRYVQAVNEELKVNVATKEENSNGWVGWVFGILFLLCLGVIFMALMAD